MLSVVVKRQLISKLNRTLFLLQETSGHEGSVREFHKRQVLSGEDAAAAEGGATDGDYGATAVLGVSVVLLPSRRRRGRPGVSRCEICLEIRLTRRCLACFVSRVPYLMFTLEG